MFIISNLLSTSILQSSPVHFVVQLSMCSLIVGGCHCLLSLYRGLGCSAKSLFRLVLLLFYFISFLVFDIQLFESTVLADQATMYV